MSDHKQIVVAGIHPLIPVQRTVSVPSALDFVGRRTNQFFEWFGEIGIFSWNVLKAGLTPPYEWRELVRQLDEVGSMSLPLVAAAGAAIGVVISMEARLPIQPNSYSIAATLPS